MEAGKEAGRAFAGFFSEKFISATCIRGEGQKPRVLVRV